MAKLVDQLLVVDIEATCWENRVTPVGQRAEIIEVGLAIINIPTMQIVEKKSILVYPTESKISEYCTNLTTITQMLADTGVSFEEACQTLMNKYKSRSRIWASYGDYDRIKFGTQCQERHVTYPFGSTHLNVKSLMCLRRRHTKEVGMAKALNILNLELEGTHHRGHDDAFNIAKILIELLK